MMFFTSLLLPIVILSDLSYAQHFQLEGRRRADVGDGFLQRRENSLALENHNDISYFVNLTLGGELFTVLIDTGSADLWVSPPNDGTVPGSVDTGANATIGYVGGSAGGPIKTGELAIGGYTIEDQAYIEVPSSSNTMGQAGLIGLGPNSGSEIEATLKSAVGYGPLDRIFRQDLTTPNFVTFLLGRTLSLAATLDFYASFPGGDLTIGTVLDGYEAIEQQPRVPLNPKGMHYQFMMDEDSIRADGEAVEVTTVVANSSDIHRPTIVLDTGYTTSQVPASVAEAFYSKYDGAELVNISTIGGATWTVPCTTEVHISFNIAGTEIPIHPLDAATDPQLYGVTNYTNSQGVPACWGMFQPISFDTGDLFDGLLGMSFIRNVYMYVNMGDFVAGDNDTLTRGLPYVKFLPTTNLKEAHADFVAVRGTADGSISSIWEKVIAEVASANDTSTDDTPTDDVAGGITQADVEADADSVVDKVGKKNLIIIACIAGVVVIGAIVLGVYCCARKRKQKRAAAYRAVVDEDSQPLVYGATEYETKEAFQPPLYDPYAAKLGA